MATTYSAGQYSIYRQSNTSRVQNSKQLMLKTELKVARRFAKNITVLLAVVVIFALIGLVGDYTSAFMGSRWIVAAPEGSFLALERFPLAYWSSMIFIYSAPMLAASSIALGYITSESRRKIHNGRGFRMFSMLIAIVLASVLTFLGSMVGVVLVQNMYPVL